MNRKDRELYSVLVADDSADDRSLLRSAMRRAVRLQIVGEVSDGSEVIAYFGGRGGFSDREKHPLPDLLLLDLKMPVVDGFEVLEWLRSKDLEATNVVVLTDSMEPQHIQRALAMGADMFQVKPQSQREREAMVLALEDFVLKSASAPLVA